MVQFTFHYVLAEPSNCVFYFAYAPHDTYSTFSGDVQN